MNDIFHLYLCIIFVLFQSGESESIVRTGHDHYPLPFSIIAKKKNLPFVQEFCHSGRNKFPLTNLLQILEPIVTFQEYKLTYYLFFLSFNQQRKMGNWFLTLIWKEQKITKKLQEKLKTVFLNGSRCQCS